MRKRNGAAVLMVIGSWMLGGVMGMGEVRNEQSPVGHWTSRAPDQPAKESEMVFWYDFRPDGSLSATVGNEKSSTYELHGSTLVVGKETPEVGAGVFDISFEGEKLVTVARAMGGQRIVWSRVGGSGEPGSQIAGCWLAESHGGDERTWVQYGSDGRYVVRQQIGKTEGTWSMAAKTYKLMEGEATELPFQRHGGQLELMMSSHPADKQVYSVDGFCGGL